MAVEVLVVQGDTGTAAGIALTLGRLRIHAVVVRSAEEARGAIASARAWRGFLVDPKLSSHDDAGVEILAEIARSKRHRFAPRAALSRVASARLITLAAKLGARYLCYPCDRDAFAYFAFDVHGSPIEDEGLRAYVTELGVAAGLTAQELATLAAHLSGPHETVGERLGIGDSTVATHVRGILAKLTLFRADAANMHALESWILRRARRRS